MENENMKMIHLGILVILGLILSSCIQVVGANELGGIPADVNGDGVVDVLDLLLVLSVWNETGDHGWIPEDINLDGVVDVLDLLEVLAHWS
jgi:hypothetical protein